MNKNEYGLFTAIAMVVGIVIGSGIFFKSDNILIATGGSVSLGILVFALAAIAIIFGSLTISELASRTITSGGIIGYAEEYYNRTVACAFGWFQAFLYYPALLAVVAWVAGVYICMLFGLDSSLTTQILIAVAIVVVLFITNTLSAKLGGCIQNTAMIIKLIPLIFIAVIGMIYGDTAHISFSDVVSMKSAGWLTALAPIAFSFDGWIISTSIGHEIKDSKKNLPKALIIAPIFILLIYIAYFVGVCTYLGPDTVMALGDGHIDLIANKILGPFGAKIVLIFVIISVLGTLNGIILGLIRLPHSLAVRGMFPKSKFVAKMNDKRGVPLNSAIIGFGLFIFWTFIHYLTTKFGLLVNSDVSEISTSLSYLMYSLLYIKVFKLGREGAIKGIWRGVVNPILAIVGALVIVVGSLSSPLFVVYLAICGAVVLSAIGFWKRKEKNMKQTV